mmetsp:Transcript_101908/g.328918  ORF Transcript_101908/g.328918 Transcript_101908/m.328918 type:complete len:220 (-) Transcript_101908:182-841(-)
MSDQPDNCLQNSSSTCNSSKSFSESGEVKSAVPLPWVVLARTGRSISGADEVEGNLALLEFLLRPKCCTARSICEVEPEMNFTTNCSPEAWSPSCRCPCVRPVRPKASGSRCSRAASCGRAKAILTSVPPMSTPMCPGASRMAWSTESTDEHSSASGVSAPSGAVRKAAVPPAAPIPASYADSRVESSKRSGRHGTPRCGRAMPRSATRCSSSARLLPA